MIVKTTNICEKNVDFLPANAIIVPAGISTLVVADLTGQAEQIASITIQNNSAGNCFYAFSQTCDSIANYHGILPPYVQLNCPTTKAVYVYSDAGCTIAVTVMIRKGTD